MKDLVKSYNELIFNEIKPEYIGLNIFKIFANGNLVQDSVQKVTGLLSSNTGFNIGEILEALSNTPMGKELLDKFLNPKKD